MNFKSIGLGIALSCGTFAVGSTVGLSQAQAATIGNADFAGLVSFQNKSQVNPLTETLNFKNPGTVLDASGIFTGATEVVIGSGNPYSLLLNKISGSESGTSALYKVADFNSVPTTFLSFNNGLKFEVTSISNFLRTTNLNSTTIDGFSIAGKFYNGSVNAIADGAITAQVKKGAYGSYSYSIVATDVPEPLTILGSATALGFGTMLKKKYSKKQSKEKAIA
ncbi:MAG: PEP-CTERM sorting domain-containing protein [Aulosira sp. ZfuVER01]|nr:PEP-CTERM sorting domain-containing protein [Aulosira sp. ZfuVER01]MDZ8002491.1 PEP-CTERM sorting domain-containing protein [Aulosira sp. DedVER01a]MDZ8050831.1 PEP-CTERM sorting domain-containing protein [Aulosira sp. ZfuCHP01]